MSDPVWQAHPQAPFPYNPPRPGGSIVYPQPNQQNGTFSSPQALAMQQGYQPLGHPSADGTYTFRPMYQIPPGTNNSMSVNQHGFSQGVPGVPTQQVSTPHGNLTPAPQTPYNTFNANQYYHNAPRNIVPRPRPSQYPVNGTPPLTPQPNQQQFTAQGTPRNAYMAPGAPRASHNPAGNGQRAGQGYRAILTNTLLPGKYPNNGNGTAVPGQQASNQVFNGGSSPRFMPPQAGSYPTNGQVAAPGPASVPQRQPQRQLQPATRYNLQTTPMPPPSSNRQVASRPGVSNGNRAQGGSWTARPSSSIPIPLTNAPAAEPRSKRPADSPAPQQPAKRQRRPESSTAQQSPQPLAKDSQVITDREGRSTPEVAAEPEHLPKYLLSKIRVDFLIEPDPAKPPPKGRTVMTWAEAIEAIKEVLATAEFGHILRPLAKLRDLTDAVEVFIARPGRRPLLTSELAELLTVRYARVIEEGIALTELSLYTPHDWDTATTEVKEKVVREAWEKRAAKRLEDGPSIDEAIADSFKWFFHPPRDT